MQKPPSSSSSSSHRQSKPPSLCRFLQTCKCISLDDVALPSPLPPSHLRSPAHPDPIPNIDRRRLHYPPSSRTPLHGHHHRWIFPPPHDSSTMASFHDSLPCLLQEKDRDSSKSCGMPVGLIDTKDLADEEDAYGEEMCKEMDCGRMVDGGGIRQHKVSGYGDCLCKDCAGRVMLLEGGEVKYSCCCNYVICCKEMEEFEAISHKMKLLQVDGGEADRDSWRGNTMDVHGSCSSSRHVMRAATPNSKPMDYYRIWEDCVLQEKYSYHASDDFYDSMLEIVILKRIIELRDLKKLLTCYFSINPPVHHDLIEEAFVNLLANVYYQNND